MLWVKQIEKTLSEINNETIVVGSVVENSVPSGMKEETQVK